MIALTMAYTPTPQSRLKGEALSVDIGTAQDLLPETAGFVPSQLTGSVVKVKSSLCLI